jgi:two-component system cell cycle response regulator PopA
VGTGLFTRDLFAAHLGRLAKSAQARARPLSICVLRISDTAELARARAGGWIDRATPQIGSMIGRLVRTEDTAARLAPEVFALALPSTPAVSARASAERISAVIACTAFESGDGNPPFVVDFDIGVAQVEPGERPGRALERAASQSLQQKAG